MSDLRTSKRLFGITLEAESVVISGEMFDAACQFEEQIATLTREFESIKRICDEQADRIRDLRAQNARLGGTDSSDEPKVKCTGCNDVGHVGGLTPEGYESQPCPFCTTEPPRAWRIVVDESGGECWLKFFGPNGEGAAFQVHPKSVRADVLRRYSVSTKTAEGS